MRKLNENQKITLTIGQLKQLVKESADENTSLFNDVKTAIADSIDDIFWNFQERLGIKYGDISPDEVVDLDDKIEALATLVSSVLEEQKQG